MADIWECPECKYPNGMSRTECSGCGTIRPAHITAELEGGTYQPPEVVCPKCRCKQVHAEKRGFKLGRAVAGAVVAGAGVGLVSGLAGHGKIMVTCLNCGHRWEAGKPGA